MLMKFYKKTTSQHMILWLMLSVVLTILITVSLNVWALSVKPRVFVYVSTMTRASTLQKKLQGAMSKTQVKVFSRIRDFKKAVSDESPDAVIARKNLVQGVQMKPGLQGVLNGKKTEAYVLLTVDNSVDITTLNGKNVGAVDELGRRQTASFVEKSLGVKPTVKRTVKVENLLALLQFSAADAIFLPKRLTETLKKSSQLTLVETPVPGASMPLPVAAFASDEATAVVAPAIKELSRSINSILGVDSWQ
ncbi:MAG: hypothetical protein JXR76_10680 [Deltaproteobacteria bacterium]|nr:hypothetical protein [Deltaproteobacteria bacterium]